MWLIKSSIGRKVVMAVTGFCLILFLLFHASMNVVAIFSESSYNWICQFLGTHWYALAGTLGLAGLAVIHIIFAFWLNMLNKKARGENKYAVVDKPASVEWASQNMLVLGIVIGVGLLLHLLNFWYHMMFNELVHGEGMAPISTNGVAWIAYTFKQPLYVFVYLIWLGALWFHLNHGFWSSLQTMGWNNKIWFKRWQKAGLVVSSLIVGMFVAVIFAYVTGLSGKDYKDIDMAKANSALQEKVKKEKEDAKKSEKYGENERSREYIEKELKAATPNDLKNLADKAGKNEGK